MNVCGGSKPAHKLTRPRIPVWLGTWWTSAWFHASVPGYPDYPVGPHFAGWLLLSALGLLVLVLHMQRRRPIAVPSILIWEKLDSPVRPRRRHWPHPARRCRRRAFRR